VTQPRAFDSTDTSNAARGAAAGADFDGGADGGGAAFSADGVPHERAWWPATGYMDVAGGVCRWLDPNSTVARDPACNRDGGAGTTHTEVRE